MMKKILSILVILMSLAGTGCNLLIKVPFGGPKLIPTETFFLDEAPVASEAITTAVLSMAPSNGSLYLAGGAVRLVEGTIQYNVASWRPTLTVQQTVFQIEQEVPKNSVSSTPKDSLNQWDLKLGKPLSSLSISCPTGNYTLKFADSALPDNASISVNAGVGNLRLVFQADATVNVEIHRGPANINTEGVWTANGRTYTSGNTGPVWTVKIEIGVVNLTLVAE